MSKSAFDLYSYSQYKSLLKDRLRFLRDSKPHLSWRFIALKIPMQPTYLSKALGESKAQLSEDDVFRICQWLEFRNEETEFVLLVRSANVTGEKERREFLIKKIEDLRKRRVVSADYVETQAEELGNEMDYLLDPMAVLVHGALFLSRFKNDPLLLCSQLGISETRLKKVLKSLQQCRYIALGSEQFRIKEVFSKSPHFGREHPLTRIHQIAMKSVLMSRLSQTAEEDKESFLATFTMDEKNFAEVKAAFHEFIRKTQEIAQPSRQDKTHKLFQLNFDFLKWF